MGLEIALFCMALNIYHEARGEPLKGRQAVALVTWNRAGRDKDKICEVVTAEKQFSWTITKLVKLKDGRYKLKESARPKEKEAWRSALFTARLVMKGRLLDFTRGSTHYHANYVRPYWASSMVKTKVVGRHIFYKLG